MTSLYNTNDWEVRSICHHVTGGQTHRIQQCGAIGGGSSQVWNFSQHDYYGCTWQRCQYFDCCKITRGEMWVIFCLLQWLVQVAAGVHFCITTATVAATSLYPYKLNSGFAVRYYTVCTVRMLWVFWILLNLVWHKIQNHTKISIDGKLLIREHSVFEKMVFMYDALWKCTGKYYIKIFCYRCINNLCVG